MSGWLAHPGPARTHSSATAGVHGHTDGELGQRPGQGMDVDEMEGDIGDGEDIDMAFDDGDFGMPQDVSDNEDMIEMESPDSRSSDQSSDDEGYETPVARKMKTPATKNELARLYPLLLQMSLRTSDSTHVTVVTSQFLRLAARYHYVVDGSTPPVDVNDPSRGSEAPFSREEISVNNRYFAIYLA
ncbi:hypothetical protein B0H11DRAFT_1905070 [Mycena galericulata]|nr:hypothetical protein B0H11DRAFT_1905070 [Mycena galericulata]